MIRKRKKKERKQERQKKEINKNERMKWNEKERMKERKKNSFAQQWITNFLWVTFVSSLSIYPCQKKLGKRDGQYRQIGSGYFDVKTLPPQPFWAKKIPFGHKAERKPSSDFDQGSHQKEAKREFYNLLNISMIFK